MEKKKDLGHLEHMKKAQNMGIRDAVTRPIKIVFMGSGSTFFKPLLVDVLNIPGATEGEMALVDIDEERLELSRRLGEKIIAISDRAAGWKVTATNDRVSALRGADYIINCIEVSGTECVRFDNDIPLEYGIDQCIGDTIGPGGIFKALRTGPVLLEVLADVEKYCPDAWILNYTNPMSILCLAAFRAAKVKMVGLCHSVQGTSKVLAGYLGIPYEEMRWRCAGINHLAWFTELSYKGRDLYPEFIERVKKDPEFLAKDPVRMHFMTHFDCFVTESSGHFSEYLPYYRKRPELIEKHCGADYLGQSSFYADSWPVWRSNNDELRKKMIIGEEAITMDRSWEYASYIIEAIETNNPFKIYCTVPNTGIITNLPQDNVAEVACTVDAEGVVPNYYGKLPPHLAQICRSQMGAIDLAAQACIEKSKELAIRALMLDPLTSAVCSLDEIREMGNRLFEAEKNFLPGFK